MCAHELLADPDDAVFEVDIAPAQPEHLAAAKTVDQQQHERRIHGIPKCSIEEPAGFISRPWLLPRWTRGRQGREPRHVTLHQFLAHRPGERRTCPASRCSGRVRVTGLDVEPVALTGVYKNMTRAIIALVFRCKITGGDLRTSDETTAFRWAAESDVTDLADQAYAVRILDALHDERPPAIRQHDGVRPLKQRTT